MHDYIIAHSSQQNRPRLSNQPLCSSTNTPVSGMSGICRNILLCNINSIWLFAYFLNLKYWHSLYYFTNRSVTLHKSPTTLKPLTSEWHWLWLQSYVLVGNPGGPGIHVGVSEQFLWCRSRYCHAGGAVSLVPVSWGVCFVCNGGWADGLCQLGTTWMPGSLPSRMLNWCSMLFISAVYGFNALANGCT